MDERELTCLKTLTARLIQSIVERGRVAGEEERMEGGESAREI